MKSIRGMVRDIIEHRVLPWIERDGITNLILPEQITPADCARPIRCISPIDVVRHPAHEFGIGLTGLVPHCIEGKRFIFTQGRIVLLPAGTPHGAAQRRRRKTGDIDLEESSSVLWLLAYPFGVLVQISQVQEDTHTVTPSVILPERQISALAGRLVEEMRSRLHNYAGISRCILMEFMGHCIRATAATMDAGFTPALRSMLGPVSTRPAKGRSKPSKSARRPTKDNSGQVSGRVREAQDFIHSNFNESINLEEIAEAVNSSTDHLGRLFKAATGRTPIQYLLDVRMKTARQLLLTNLEICKIAQWVGIQDPCYFSRVFHRINGVSPRQYRRQMTKAGKRPQPSGNPRQKHKSE